MKSHELPTNVTPEEYFAQRQHLRAVVRVGNLLPKVAPEMKPFYQKELTKVVLLGFDKPVPKRARKVLRPHQFHSEESA